MPLDGATTFYLTQGVLGITVVILGIVIVMQDRRYRQDLKEKDLTIAVLQEKRANDAPIYADKFITTSQTLMGQFKELLNLEMANQKGIETIANILQSLKNKI